MSSCPDHRARHHRETFSATRSPAAVVPVVSPRRGLLAAFFITLLTLVALHIDCAGPEFAVPTDAVPTAAHTAKPALAHLGAHLPARDDCCAHDRHPALDTVLPAGTKPGLAGLLWWIVAVVAVTALASWAATAVRGPPIRPAPARTGRDILTHLSIDRR
ncbi:hypothetical protein [Nocardia veterana]|uniref:Transmembrane protein n=1 Tax=Nocardia veterana TaxID=132249 RepID=A0A7X6M012_9NOCA|nr:hypothetical protein [Nocardia veterana]NKY87789.1 hypothetical protein [Nocardia veterana]